MGEDILIGNPSYDIENKLCFEREDNNLKGLWCTAWFLTLMECQKYSNSS